MHLKYLHYFGNESSESILEEYGIIPKEKQQTAAFSYINATEYMTKVNDTAYSISYIAEEEDFPKYRKSLDSIISLFETIESEFSSIIPFFDRDLGIMLEYPYPNVKKVGDTDTSVTFSFSNGLAIFDDPTIILTVSNSSNQGGSRSSRDQGESIENTTLHTTLGTNLTAEKTVVNVTMLELFQNQTVMQINSAPLLNNLDNRKYSYNITFVAYNDEYEKYLPIVEQIISTIRIVEYASMGSNLSNHTFSDYGFKLKYPSSWQYEDYGSGFVNFYPPNPNSTASVEFIVSPPVNESMFDIVKEDIETLSQPQQPNSDSTSFSLIDSEVKTVINGSNDQVIANIKVKGEPWVVAVNDLKNTIYVTHPGFLSLLDGTNNTLVSGIPISAESPISMAINPKTNRIYVADDFSKNVTVIDSRINKVVDEISTIDPNAYDSENVPSSGVGVSVDPLRNRLYSVNNLDGMITVIDGKNNSIIEKIPIGSFTDPIDSSEISVNPYTKKAYLVGNTGSKVYEIDLSPN